MKFNTITQIAAHQFIGNHASDHLAFMAIDEFVQNEQNSLADRAEAIRIMSDKGMGCGRDEWLSDAAIVADYIDNL